MHAILGHTAQAKEYAEQARKSDSNAAAKILEAFYDDYFSRSAQVQPSSKAMIERLLHGFKIS